MSGCQLSHQILEQPVQPAAFDKIDAGKLHHLFHLGTVGFGVTVDRTLLAFGLGIERTFVQLFKRILFQCRTVGTECAVGAVLLTTVHPDKLLQQ